MMRTHVRDESHVEHAVGFVEHKSLDLLQVHRLLLDVIEQPTGSRHQKLDALAQRRGLRLHVDPPNTTVLRWQRSGGERPDLW